MGSLTCVTMVSMVMWLSSMAAADPGTTPNIENIFLGRCHEFQQFIRPELFTDSQKNCTELWELFKAGVAGKPHCNSSMEDFKAFADAVAHPIPANTAVYYYGMYPFVYKYSDRGYRATAMDSYMPGHIAQGFNFCGSETDSSGFDPESCPDYKSCDGHAQVNYWASVSERFSLDTEGDVLVFLNGSRGVKPSFKPTSIFGSNELKNLVPPRVTKLTAWVVHTAGAPKTESCGKGSLLELKQMAAAQKLVFSCVDDPPATLFLQCVSAPNAPECKKLLEDKADTSSQSRVEQHGALVICVLILARFLVHSN